MFPKHKLTLLNVSGICGIKFTIWYKIKSGEILQKQITTLI